MEGGWTKKRRATPPTEKPISCVDMTSSHWSTRRGLRIRIWSVPVVGSLTDERVVLVVENSLNGHNVGGICTVGTDARHDRGKNMLLHVEWPGIEFKAKDTDVGQQLRPSASHREHQELCHSLTADQQ